MAMFIDRAMDLPPTDQDFFDDDDGADRRGEPSIAWPRPASPAVAACAATARTTTVTRAQMASFLVRALDLPPPVEPDHFSDDDSSTHEADIDSLFEAGITAGCGAGPVLPDGNRDPRPDGRIPVPRVRRLHRRASP